MKAYTDLEQSKKLAEILPLESADMFYRSNGIDAKLMWEHNAQKVEYPCWSLAALLSVLPTIDDEFEPQLHRSSDKYRCTYEGRKDTCSGLWIVADNPVDACYKMIVKLHERKLL